MSIKGGANSIFMIFYSLILFLHARIRPLSGARYWHLPQSPSRDLGASLPLSPRLYPLLQAPRCKIIQCTRTPLLDVWPRGRNQNKPLRYCVTSCINHLGLGTRSIITSWCQVARFGHRQFDKAKVLFDKGNMKMSILRHSVMAQVLSVVAVSPVFDNVLHSANISELTHHESR